MIDLEDLSARLHEVYQKEAHRRGDVRHADAYADLPDDTKEWTGSWHAGSWSTSPRSSTRPRASRPRKET